MNGLHFDIVSKELVIKNNDFQETENPSVQNGGIIEFSRATFINTPMLGIGITDFINSNSSTVPFQMNRWQLQCKTDGATLAKWAGVPLPESGIKLTTEISYL